MIVYGTQDAGPAEYISRIINNTDQKYLCFSSKISKIVFSKNNIPSQPLDFQLLVPEEIRFIIVGSSHNKNKLDYELLKWSKQNKIAAILVIEHWTNLKQRISFIEKTFFPDQIWVNDSYVKENLVKLNVNKEVIKIVGNPVLEKQEKFLTNQYPKIFNKIIFISEEMNSDEINLKPKYGFDEYEVIDFILKHRNPNTPFFIKLHPAENKLKYRNLTERPNINLIDDIELFEIGQKSLIIGINSILLLELALQGFSIYSYRPNQKEEFIGAKLNLTYNLNSAELISILKTHHFIKFNKKDISFNGSMECIKKIIKK